MTTVVSIASCFNSAKNHVLTFAMNADRTVRMAQDVNLSTSVTWLSLPNVAASGTPISLTASYSEQLNQVVLTAAMTTGECYRLVNPLVGETAWVPVTSISVA